MATDLWGATITLGAGALLVLIVIGQKTLLAWPQGLLNTQAAEALAVLANGFTSHAGMSATMLIAFAAIPAVLSLRADIELAADIATKEGPNDKREWLQKNQLDLAPASVATAALTTAAPMLASPVVDIVETLLQG